MNRRKAIISTFMVATMTAAVGIVPADTTFTYQGELKDNGNLATGSFDMDFSLWDAANGGNQMGAAIAIPSVPVAAGKFAVELDFGADVFNNADRWLEIGIGGFALDPRTKITRSPYAVQTRGMFVSDDGNVTFDSLNAADGTVRITSPGGIDFVIDADTNNIGEDQNARVVLRQDGGQVVGRMGYREGNNKLEVVQEYADDLILGTNNQDRVWIRPDGFVGIGRPDKVTSAEVFGVFADTPSGFGGMYVETAGTDGLPFYGYSAGGGVDAYHYFNGQTDRWTLYVGGDRLDVNRSTGDVRIFGDVTFFGNVTFPSGTSPAYAYGRIAENGTIISGSPSLVSVTHNSTGQYGINVAGGVLSTDVAVASVDDLNTRIAMTNFSGNSLTVVIRRLDNSVDDQPFCFVLYRPQ